MNRDKILEEILDYFNNNPHFSTLIGKKLSPRLHRWLYPHIEKFINTKLKYSRLPEGVFIDPPDLINIYFMKTTIGQKIVQTVKDDIAKLTLGTSYTTKDIIDVFTEIIYKRNIDHLGFSFENEGDKDFKSFWDKYSETI